MSNNAKVLHVALSSPDNLFTLSAVRDMREENLRVFISFASDYSVAVPEISETRFCSLSLSLSLSFSLSLSRNRHGGGETKKKKREKKILHAALVLPSERVVYFLEQINDNVGGSENTENIRLFI